ncbi:hypothetical protein [Nocardia flavorosea]|uniref:Uncharacterized protein n=1 Tax=Nocardia flavorosea TaxID=53429 RepID=A0A846YMZ4_9NOCA|nr:hypothetical protein [Nocardia flavorosea]NKY60415.1 hypothetical protein [Nocardia flavorosea]
MRHNEITTAAVRDALGLPADPRMTIDIDWDGTDFRGTYCVRTGDPAAVHVDFSLIEVDHDGPFTVAGADAYSWEYAGQGLSRLLAHPGLNDDYGVHVTVLAWAALYAPHRAAA